LSKIALKNHKKWDKNGIKSKIKIKFGFFLSWTPGINEDSYFWPDFGLI
jgi:hypothetical protein